MTTLRVASYNTRDFLDDRAAAARVVRAIAPDILCLQEVPRRLFATRRVAGFARECRMHWPGRHHGSGGTTIFLSSRMRVLASHHYRLPVSFPQRTRGYAVARVELPGTAPVTAVSVHLPLKQAQRSAHAAAILRQVGAAPTILCGDVNEEADGPAWRLFATPLRLISPAAPTYPARSPRKLLDVVFASPGVQAAAHVELPLPEDDVLAGSDHRPVWVDVRLPARSET